MRMMRRLLALLSSRSERGVSMVEMAIVLPVFLMVIFGSLALSNVFTKKLSLHTVIQKTNAAITKVARPPLLWPDGTYPAPMLCSEALENIVRSELGNIDLPGTLRRIRGRGILPPIPEASVSFEYEITIGFRCTSCVFLPGLRRNSGGEVELRRSSIANLGTQPPCGVEVSWEQVF